MNNINQNNKCNFIDLSVIDDSIIQSVRYATKNNFIGRPIQGYNAAKIIITYRTAVQLSKIQKELQNSGYNLVVYDGYRPQSAVDDFVRWSISDDDSMKSLYYPNLSKNDIFDLKYVASKSSHTRGSTVDVSIVAIDCSVHDIIVSTRVLANGQTIPFLDDGTVDMGSSFDLFHVVSDAKTNLIDDIFQKRRDFLRNIMQKYGFKGVKNEWWHFTLQNECYPNTYFNFDISTKFNPLERNLEQNFVQNGGSTIKNAEK